MTLATKTAAQRREEDRIAFENYLRDCPTTQLLERISNRWASLIVSSLGERQGSMRYSELSRKIAGVSQKMLTQTLRSLERDGILSRTVTPSVPVRVDYELTELGRSLYGMLLAMREWADANIPKINEARARHDANANQ